jgi:hypothetical protein
VTKLSKSDARKYAAAAKAVAAAAKAIDAAWIATATRSNDAEAWATAASALRYAADSCALAALTAEAAKNAQSNPELEKK